MRSGRTNLGIYVHQLDISLIDRSYSYSYSYSYSFGLVVRERRDNQSKLVSDLCVCTAFYLLPGTSQKRLPFKKITCKGCSYGLKALKKDYADFFHTKSHNYPIFSTFTVSNRITTTRTISNTLHAPQGSPAPWCGTRASPAPSSSKQSTYFGKKMALFKAKSPYNLNHVPLDSQGPHGAHSLLFGAAIHNELTSLQIYFMK